jgi:hypothetical protein
MRAARAVVRRLVVAALAAALLAAVSNAAQGRVPVEAYVVVIGGLALLDALVLFHRLVAPSDPGAGGGPLVRVRRGRPPPRAPVPGLLQWEAVLAAARSSGRATATRLRPRLRELTADVLAMHGGPDLDGEPDRARALLGERAWALLERSAVTPEYDAPGVPVDDVDALIARLETILSPEQVRV